MADTQKFHSASASKAFSLLGSSHSGLSQQEAQKRISTYGRNILVETKPPQWPKLLLAQFNNILIIMLIVAAGLSFYVGKQIDGVVIFIAVVLSVLFGFLQEYKAESALSALKSLTNPKALVLRDGRETLIDARDLVPGDIILLSEGDKIPADCLLLESANISVDQSSLTGESRPTHKREGEVSEHTHLAERTSMLYAGTTIVRGHGKSLVAYTGKHTEFGKIASSLSSTSEEQAPLQKSLSELGKKIGFVAIGLSVLFFIFGILRGEPFEQMFVVAISLAVASIPEGLPTIITITLAVGVQAMSKKKAIVRRLPAVETLGSATVICTDKTGTLTQNRITVTHLWAGDSDFTFDGIALEDGHMHFGHTPSSQAHAAHAPAALAHATQMHAQAHPNATTPPNDTLTHPTSTRAAGNLAARTHTSGKPAAAHSSPNAPLPGASSTTLPGAPAATQQLALRALEIGVLCNSSTFIYTGEKLSGIAGDPTEAALLVAAKKAFLEPETLRSSNKLIAEFPFDSDRKMMSVVRNTSEGTISFVKGAPEMVLPHCKKILTQNGEVPLNSTLLKSMHAKTDEFSLRALRVLALAYKKVKEKPHYALDDAERELVLVGFVGMIDPPRKEVASAIETCRHAGIRVIMVTGDSRPTAVAIAKQIGLMAEGEEDTHMLGGDEIDSLDEYRLSQRLSSTAVCCRTTPEQKLRIVSTLSKKGEVVAVTGDGVNDAPAIKRASIGIAMGISGTDVAKEVSDMVLLDDNFSTIVTAIEHGRSIYRNIKSFVRYQFSTSVAAMAAMFFPPFLGLSLPMGAIQILWVNLIMDGPPALALGAEPSSEGEMDKPPRNPHADFVSRNMILSIAITGLCMAAVTIFTLFIFTPISAQKATTVAFTAFVFMQLANALNCKAPDISLFKNLFSNKYLLAAIMLSIALQMCILYIPYLQQIFGTVPLEPVELLFALSSALLLILFGELKKRFFKDFTKY
ncbi:cation-transporting P-type ATPase [Candidatus Micrarchaeota archaeon]|nr:cation-transporting P-type ATPase [Candidatus Micrarchaeota archaeon]